MSLWTVSSEGVLLLVTADTLARGSWVWGSKQSPVGSLPSEDCRPPCVSAHPESA